MIWKHSITSFLFATLNKNYDSSFEKSLLLHSNNTFWVDLVKLRLQITTVSVTIFNLVIAFCQLFCYCKQTCYCNVHFIILLLCCTFHYPAMLYGSLPSCRKQPCYCKQLCYCIVDFTVTNNFVYYSQIV